MRQDVGETPEVAQLEQLRLVSTYGDLEAWAAFQQSMEETVLNWLHAHPGREAACHVQSERHFVAQAFEQVQQAVVQRQVACETLSEVSVYLRASLSGIILETLRAFSRPRVASEYVSEKQDLPGKPQSLEVWSWVQAAFPNERERRLAYLLYHCGLEPAEIVRYYPQEWSDAREVTRLRCSILKHLTKGWSSALAQNGGACPVAPSVPL